MLTPSRALGLASSAACLPDVPDLRELHAHGVRPRRGQLMMIAGQPGSMKSTLAMWWAARMAIPTLYFSADMAPHTASTRLAAVLSGDRVSDVSDALEGPGRVYYEWVLEQSKIQFCFDSGPSLEDIALEVDAYVETYDAWPELIVIDNVMNVDTGLDMYQGAMLVMSELHSLARVTSANVWALHHTTEATTLEPWQTQPRKDIQGKISQLPEMILTVAYEEATGGFRIAPVKNRNSRADPTGRTYFELQALPDQASFTGIPHRHFVEEGKWTTSLALKT